ncbi:hypothetical protein [Deinococcus sp. QL22]|uniref:hypothetical protein n=1 Tax=Deinococcus sp. QL22 TaxID=2939437 RepID=UPI002017B5BB|nr:hypothetical protein [Deinococcus sp. QL22]UQN10300.1 hypothetical protein M1R55_29555 [Deinococcus sp. QL22]UQN10434.1 hypothetical protein M1R55_28880 [Deinococcus sp. QL22]
MSVRTEVKAKPIIFSALMVQAILAGTKSQTRRLIKPQPPVEDDMPYSYPYYWGAVGTYSGVSEPRHYWCNYVSGEAAYKADDDLLLWPPDDDDSDEPAEDGWYGPGGMESPYGSGANCMKRAARLWVREAFTLGVIPLEMEGGSLLKRGPIIETGHFQGWQQAAWYDGTEDPWGWFSERKRMSPIYMPRWASRITLELTSVEVQRLQHLSEKEARAEGVFPAGQIESKYRGEGRDLFRQKWDQLNGKGSWDANPWVWNINFKRVDA